MDLFVVPTFSFRLLYGLLIMLHGRRQMLWLGATAHPTAEWIARSASGICATYSSRIWSITTALAHISL